MLEPNSAIGEPVRVLSPQTCRKSKFRRQNKAASTNEGFDRRDRYDYFIGTSTRQRRVEERNSARSFHKRLMILCAGTYLPAPIRGNRGCPSFLPYFPYVL